MERQQLGSTSPLGRPGWQLEAAGGGGGGRLLIPGQEAAAGQEAHGGEAGAVVPRSTSGSPPATLGPDAERVPGCSPFDAKGPLVTATPTRRPFALHARTSLPEEAEARGAGAILSPEEAPAGREPVPPGQWPAVQRWPERGGEASRGPVALGALPPTPRLPVAVAAAAAAAAAAPAEDDEDDELYRQSLEMISRYLREEAVGAVHANPLGGSTAGRQGALETLRRVGAEVRRQHEAAFQGMIRQLDLKNGDDLQSVSRAMADVFSDGVTNWGRIVTLLSFGAFVAKHLKGINQESCIEPLAESITDILARTKRDWLVKHGGWDGFVEFFRVEDLEGGIRNVLLALAGVAGIGAGLAYLLR